MAVNAPRPALLLALLLVGGPTAAAAAERPAHPVAVAEARTSDEVLESERTGTLRVRRRVKVLSREEGRITGLPYHPGDRVEAGAAVLRLDDSLLRAELRKAEAQRRQARTDLTRIERLHARDLVSEEALSQARTALDVAAAEAALLETRLGHTVERAPFAGVVSARLAEPGDAVAEFTHVLTLLDPRSVYAEVPVSDLLLARLAEGDAVTLRVDALGPTAHAGTIHRLHPAVDPRSRRGVVEVTFDHRVPGIRPGQLCRATFREPAGSVLAVPFTALRRDRDGEYVYRVVDGRAVRTPVITGRHLGGQVEVVDGLEAGATVVIRGFLRLHDGMAVRVTGDGG